MFLLECAEPWSFISFPNRCFLGFGFPSLYLDGVRIVLSLLLVLSHMEGNLENDKIGGYYNENGTISRGITSRFDCVVHGGGDLGRDPLPRLGAAG